jgi:hypothetical protein
VRVSIVPAFPSTAEQLVVGGANDVCGPPGTASPGLHAASLAFGAVVGVVFALALVGRVRVTRGRAAALVLAAALIAAPGARALLVDRADSPLHADATATAIATLLGDIDSYAAGHHGCVAEIHDDCVACQPLFRFVLPQRAPCAPGAGRIDVAKGVFASSSPHGQPCSLHGDALECGEPKL